MLCHIMRKAALLVSAVSALAGAGRASVHIVPPSAGFAGLQATLDAAADGDIVLLQAGIYSLPPDTSYHIVGKGLTLASDTGGSVVPALSIDALPAGHAVYLRNIGFSLAVFTTPQAPLSVHGAGTVCMEDCAVFAPAGYHDAVTQTNQAGSPGIVVDGSASLLMQHCQVNGGNGRDKTAGGSDEPTAGGNAVEVRDSARLYSSLFMFTGGNGGQGDPSPLAPDLPDGGSALVVTGSAFVDLTGMKLFGGSNGLNSTTSADEAGDGIRVESSTATVRRRVCSIKAGALLGSGVPGQPVDAPPGTVSEYFSVNRMVFSDLPVREGESTVIQVSGLPNDQAILLASTGIGFAPIPAKEGVFQLDPAAPLIVVPLPFPLDPIFGTGDIVVTMPQLPPGMDGVVIPIQLAINRFGYVTLEDVTAMVWVDSSF